MAYWLHDMKGIGIRWLIFEAWLVLSLLPALFGLSWLPQLTGWPRFFNLAWIWLIMATSPGGIARTEFDGSVYLANSAWLISLALWALAGLGWACLLSRVRLPQFALLALPAVLATGFLGQLLLRAAGFTAYVGV